MRITFNLKKRELLELAQHKLCNDHEKPYMKESVLERQ